MKCPRFDFEITMDITNAFMFEKNFLWVLVMVIKNVRNPQEIMAKLRAYGVT